MKTLSKKVHVLKNDPSEGHSLRRNLAGQTFTAHQGTFPLAGRYMHITESALGLGFVIFV